jgi:hypothetical protein
MGSFSTTFCLAPRKSKEFCGFCARKMGQSVEVGSKIIQAKGGSDLATVEAVPPDGDWSLSRNYCRTGPAVAITPHRCAGG